MKQPIRKPTPECPAHLRCQAELYCLLNRIPRDAIAWKYEPPVGWIINEKIIKQNILPDVHIAAAELYKSARK